jgi:glucosamine--fructose-6-phosphate aminotransferase (isomerizing)
MNNISLLEQEIREQPAIITRMLERETENVRRIVHGISGRFTHVVIAARGTSDNAARYAKYLLGAHNGTQVALATPSLFTMYRQPPKMEGALVIGISQSGQSPDIVSVISEGKRQGRPTVAITNETSSPLAMAADSVIPLHAGEEKAIAATKTYTSSLAVLALFSTLLQGSDVHFEQLRAVPAKISETLDRVIPALDRVERYRYLNRLAVIGRGFNYATAFEIALKIKELTRVVAEPYSSADFRHGPVAMVGTGFALIMIAPRGAVAGDLNSLVGELGQLGAEQLIISDDPDTLDKAHLALPLPSGVPEWLTPITAVVPGQLVGMRLAIIKGLDPDRPLGLRKVTETL